MPRLRVRLGPLFRATSRRLFGARCALLHRGQQRRLRLLHAQRGSRQGDAKVDDLYELFLAITDEENVLGL